MLIVGARAADSRSYATQFALAERRQPDLRPPDVESGDWIAARMSLTVTVLPPAVSALREGRRWLRRCC
ncbi:hypothetical protein SVIOM74S_00337 [Streptomyces violarus]